MTEIEILKRIFSRGTVEVDGSLLRFEGELERYTKGLDLLEEHLGYSVPTDVAKFLRVFGGTKLFVNEYGLGLEVFPISDIVRRNHQLQQTTDTFWPTFAILAIDHSDDMLCLYQSDGVIHFGNLHHEAWEAPSRWAKEAISFTSFHSWLKMFIETSGETVPGKETRYRI